MGKFTFHPVKSLQSDPKLRMLCLFGIEGFLLQYAVSLYTLANNLYATNLGATDTQIGLVQMVPNMVAGICMIPVGFLANRTKTSRTVPFVLALFLSAAYFAYGSVPLFGEHRMTAFFVFLGMTVGGIALYNAQWQTFFGDAVEPGLRNSVFTFRSRCLFFVGIVVPLLCGNVMTHFLLYCRRMHAFAGACAAPHPLSAAQGGGKAGDGTENVHGSFEPDGTQQAVPRLFHLHHAVLPFVAPGLEPLVHSGDKICRYERSAAELFSGFVFHLPDDLHRLFLETVPPQIRAFYNHFCMRGLALCPITVASMTLLPQSARMPYFMILALIGNIPQGATNMCVVQLLLQATPKKNRALIISIYTLFVTLSNSLLPFFGVSVYTALGANDTAIFTVNVIESAARFGVLIMMILRYRMMKRRGDLFRPLCEE